MKRTHEQKDKTIWEWEETPQVTQALKIYHELVQSHQVKGPRRVIL